jgi:outer membrane receptor protein involved in Fe transport
MSSRNTLRVSLAAGTLGIIVSAVPAWAQRASGTASGAEEHQPFEEVVVTARKKEETALSVPVSVTALSAAQIENHALHSFADLAMVVPNLTVSQASGGIGGSVVLRGLGTTAGSNPSFEQTVKVNIDGVELSRGSALRLGQVDMERIEILRGPQALFFGKNSPAGVVSIRTADPGPNFELIGRLAFEPYAKERAIDAVVSGPLNETLGGRIALSASDMDGWMKNLAPQAADAANAIVPDAVTAPISKAPRATFWVARGTLVWHPSNPFKVRTKLTYAQLDGPGFQQGPNQRIYCPNGAPQLTAQVNALTTDPARRAALTSALAVDDCVANDTYANGSIRPANLRRAPAYANDVEGSGRYTMLLGSIDANWDFSEALSLTSLSGYADIREDRFDTYSYAPVDAVGAVDFGGRTGWEQISEELRLTSHFEGKLNFMLGSFFDATQLKTFTQEFTTPGPLFDHRIKGNTTSAFVQGIFNVTSTLELSGGVRWSSEKKDFSVVRNGVGQPVSPSSATFDNVSPEATLAWRPTDRLTFFGSYREGFKSGGFATPHNVGPPFTPPGPDDLYRPEQVKGFEFGMHAALFDHRLRVNGALYTYDYRNLQVNSLDNSSGLPIIRVTNAAAATIKGVEFDFSWRPDALAALAIHGSANFNDATFDAFQAGCYIGQTQAQGCTLGLNPTTRRFTAQDLSGHQLANAPKWSGTIGVSFEGQLGQRFNYLITTDANYKSKYNPHPELAPGATQAAAWFLNSSVRLSRADRGWELALIGRNLTDEYRATTSSNAPLTGIGIRTGSTIPGGLADLTGYVNRGRETVLQLTVRPTKGIR